MAEIYLGVKDVSDVPGSSAHMYFIFEFSDGTKYYVRGGAEGGGFSGSLIGNLDVAFGLYDNTSLDWRDDNEPAHTYFEIFSGTDNQISSPPAGRGL